MGYHGNYNDIKREAAVAAPQPPPSPSSGHRTEGNRPPGGVLSTASKPRSGHSRAGPKKSRGKRTPRLHTEPRGAFGVLSTSPRKAAEAGKIKPRRTSEEKVKKMVLGFLFLLYEQGNGTAVPE